MLLSAVAAPQERAPHSSGDGQWPACSSSPDRTAARLRSATTSTTATALRAAVPCPGRW